MLGNQIEEGLKIGNIIKSNSDSFVFIESDNERYFAHISNFADIKSVYELKKVANGRLASFEEGQNVKGLFAKNIKLL